MEVVPKAEVSGISEELVVRSGQPLGLIAGYPNLLQEIGKPPGDVMVDLSIQLDVAVKLEGLLGWVNLELEEDLAGPAYPVDWVLPPGKE